MIEAAIFDMDGLLIDSEPLWGQAEMKVFNELGVPLTQEMTGQTMGLRVDEVVEYWFKRYPWESVSHQEAAARVDATVIELVREQGEPLPGVAQAIAACEQANLPMAIASSSSIAMINVVVEKLHLQDKIKVIHSAHDEQFGKPHPAVYISTAAELGIHPNHCVAFEDSVNGVVAAKAAKMACVAVPEASMLHDKRFGIADVVLSSLVEFTPEILRVLART